MNANRFRIVSVAVSMTLFGTLLASALTNTWPFTTSTEYVVSDPVKIEVADDVAKLKLRSESAYDARMPQYLYSNGTERVNVNVGPDASVCVEKSNQQYQASGTYVSRVFDGGSLNQWQAISTKASNRQLVDTPGLSEALPAETNIVAIYHLNNNYQDSKAGSFGTPVGSPSFSSAAKFGSHAVSLNGSSHVITADSSLLNGKNEATFACWIKLASYSTWGGILLAYSGSTYLGLEQQNNGRIVLAAGGYMISPTSIATGRWTFVAGTISRTQRVLYFDGLPVVSQSGTFGTIVQDDYLKIGFDDYSADRTSKGLIDEVLVYDRALSAEEILALYRRASSLAVQVRSSSSYPPGGAFCGPDGSVNTFYVNERDSLNASANFSPYHQFVQYKAYLTAEPTASPLLESFAFVGSKVIAADTTYGDYLQGEFAGTTNVPPLADTPYLGLAKGLNGGYYTNGTYTSRVLDAGSVINFNQISWKRTDVQSTNIFGLRGLWRFDLADWRDDSGNGKNGSASGVTYTNLAKLGNRSAVFDGGASYATIASLGAIQSVEWWMRSEQMSDGILELVANTTYVVFSNRFIGTVGFPSGAVVTPYVNGKPHGTLLPGWNHVAVVSDLAVTNVALIVGRANGDYLAGWMDELAVYNRALTSAEITEHSVAGRRTAVNGPVRLQFRAGTNNPPTAAFTGPATLPGYFDTPGSSLGGYAGQYFQYQVTFLGDGEATPAVENVTITTASGGSYVDDTVEEVDAGTFNDDRTRWYGDEIALPDLNASVTPAINPAATSGMLALWHMDDTSWPLNGVEDATGNGFNGTAQGDAKTSTDAKVGMLGGSFDGAGDAVYIPPLGVGTLDFSVGGWFKTSATNYCALVSSYNAGDYFAIECNSTGGVVGVAGRMAFVVKNGGGQRAIASRPLMSLSDGAWHHAVGVRQGRQLMFYVDGALQGMLDLGAGYGGVGTGEAYLGKHGTQDYYFKGAMDEVFIFSRAIGEVEIGAYSGAGANSLAAGRYTSPVFDGKQKTIWEFMKWGLDTPCGKAQVADGADLSGLWHLDSTTNGTTTLDSSLQLNHGTVSGALLTNSGRFGACMAFDGTSDRMIEVADDETLETLTFTVEAWVNPSDVFSRVIVDKRDGGTPGYTLGLDAGGLPYFQVNGTMVAAAVPLRMREWAHIAGVYDGNWVRLYVDGVMQARAALGGADVANTGSFRIGLAYNGSGDFAGRIDEVAFRSRPCNGEEINDHYRAGISTARMQCRSWTGDVPGPFIGPDKTTNTYFTESTLAYLVGIIELNSNFQYRLYYSTEDYRWGPRSQGAKVAISSYPTDNPWVAPADGFGQDFFGHLLAFSHRMASNTDASVRYQISGNNGVNWYRWNAGTWEDVTGLGWDMASSLSTVSNNIGAFFAQIYPKTGGTFKFKAFLNSDGLNQTALDSTTLTYSRGRVLVTAPNGTEVGDNAWLVGVPHTITWTNAGVVNGPMIIQFSDNGGTSWSVVTSNAPNTGEYVWTTPGQNQSAARSNCLIRITDSSDTSITDQSDSFFELAYRYRLTRPNGGEKFYIGTTDSVAWLSPTNMGSVAWLYYNRNGSTTDWVRINNENIPNQSGTNLYLWSIPATNNDLLSEHARMRITVPFGGYPDISDNEYVLAGIGFVTPNSVTAWKRGSTGTVEWVSSGAGTNGVDIYFAEDGVNWTNVAQGVANTVGTNRYDWLVTSGNPSPIARLRIVARQDANVTGVSQPFTVADIDIKQPTATNVWIQNTTNFIQWTAGGAGTNVNIYYSIDDGASWNYVATTTNRDFPVVNSYAWAIPAIPGETTRVKVESTIGGGTLFAISERFSISGIRVTAPTLGTEIWKMGVMTNVLWEYAAAGGGCLIQFSYNNGATYTNVGGPGYPLLSRQFDYAPDFPSVQCRVRVQASDPGFTNVADVSDNYFTVAGLKTTKPTAGAMYTMGWATNDAILWYSAGTLNDSVKITYAPDDGAEVTVLPTTPNDERYPGSNVREWTPSFDMDPSEVGRVKVVTESVSGTYTGLSANFTLRGVRLTAPSLGSVLRIGADETIQWLTAGFDPGALGDFFLSTDGGATYGTTPLLPLPILLDLRQATWSVDSGADPTINAVIKMVVTNASIPFVAYSPTFTLRGLRILSPATNNNWAIGTTNQIQFLAASAGTFVNVYYSQDGVTYDTARPVAVNVPISNGLHTVTWVIESFREPSATSRIKVQSATQTDFAISAPFTIRGVKVLRPMSTDIWSLGETNSIIWLSIGTEGTNTVDLVRPDNTVFPIASNITATSYDWVIPVESVGTNLRVRVTDSGGSVGYSQPFRIVTEPTIEVVSPVEGVFWKLNKSYWIEWSKAGNVTPSFTVEYSLNDFVTSVQIIGTPTFTNGVFRQSWTPSDPTRLGAAKIRVTNNNNTNITDISAGFYLSPNITISKPNGGEEYYSQKPTFVEWTTLGRVPYVDLYYSTDLARRPEYWVKVNEEGPIADRGHEQLSQFLWTVANVRSPIVWLRVQDAAYTNRFDAAVEGPYDDTDALFSILYYRIYWRVYNAANTNSLSSLSVVDSAGWSESGLNSTNLILHEYPYGRFNTIWSREFFYDKVVFNWLSEPSRTNDVPMTQSEVAPDFRVMANFSYDATGLVFRSTSWIEKGGRILTEATRSIVTIYDSAGALVATLSTTTRDLNGVFWQTLPTGMAEGRVYFAKVQVEFSGTLYTAGVTFQLTVPQGSEMQEALALLNQVNTNVTDLATAQAAFRQSVNAKLDTLTNAADVILAGVTNLDLKVSDLSTQALARLETLTNTLGVIGPGSSNTVLELLDQLRSDVAGTAARILTRPTSVKAGSSFNVLFRHQPLLNVTITVTRVSGGAPVYSDTMGELTGGVYEELLTAAWGTGDFVVMCSDDAGGNDRMVIKVTTWELDDLAGTMSGISNQIAGVERSMSNLVLVASNTDRNVSGLVTNLSTLMADVDDIYLTVSNMPGQLAYLTNNIGQVAGLTNLSGSVAAMTSAVSQIIALTNMATQIDNLGALTNLTPQMAAVTSSVARLSAITNSINTMSSQMNYMTNVINQIVVLTNINPAVAAMTTAVAQVTVLTNMSSQLNYVTNVVGQMGVLTNLTPQMAALTNSMARLSSITNQLNTMSSQMNYMTNVIDQVVVLTNISPVVSTLTNAVGQITVLTNMSGQLAYVTNVVGQMGVLTNLTPQMAALTNSMARLSGITNQINTVSSQMSYVTNVINQIAALTNINSAVSAMTNSVAQIAGLTNVGAQLNFVTNALVSMQGLTNLSAQVGSLTNVPGMLASLTNMPVQLGSLSNVMGQLSGLTNLPSQMAGLTNVVTDLMGLTNLTEQVAVMTNAIGQVSGLTNLGARIDYLTNTVGQLSGLTNISGQVAIITNSIGQISGLTNLGARIDYLTNTIGQLGGLTNISGQVAGLTNLPSQMADVTNLVGKLAGITNLSDQVAVMTNAIGQVASLTNLGSRVDYLTNAVGQLSALTNVTDQLAGVSNALTQVIAVTNLSGQMASLASSVNQLAGLTNLPAQLSDISAIVSQLGNMTNDMNDVVASISQLGSLTNIGAQVDGLVDAVAGLGVVTNLGVQIQQVADVVGTLVPLTNFNERMDGLATTLGQLGGLTNLGTQVEQLSGVIGEIMALTNVATQVEGLSADMATLMDSTATLSNSLAALTAAMGSVGSTSTNLQLAIMDAAEMSSNMLSSIEERLGYVTDPAGADTVFGQLTTIEQGLTGVGGTAKQTLQKATSARTEAQNAATAIGEVKKRIGAGQLNQALEDLAVIRQALGAAAEQMRGVASTMTTEDLVKSIRDAMSKIDEMAKARGLQPLGQPADELQAGSLTDPQTVAKLLNSIAETKAMMDAMRVLMDEAVNKPVVVDWLEGAGE